MGFKIRENPRRSWSFDTYIHLTSNVNLLLEKLSNAYYNKELTLPMLTLSGGPDINFGHP